MKIDLTIEGAGVYNKVYLLFMLDKMWLESKLFRDGDEDEKKKKEESKWNSKGPQKLNSDSEKEEISGSKEKISNSADRSTKIESVESSRWTYMLMNSMLDESNNTSLAVKHFLEWGNICIDKKSYEKFWIDPMWINNWTKHMVTNAELTFTFFRLYDLLKTKTTDVVWYLKKNYMNEEEQKAPWVKIRKYRDALEKSIWSYQLDMDMNKLPVFWYVNGFDVMVSDDSKVVSISWPTNNSSQRWMWWSGSWLPSSIMSEELYWRQSTKASNTDKVKWDFDQLHDNQLINDNWPESHPRYTLISVKWKIIRVSPLYIASDYESLLQVMQEKAKHRTQVFDAIVGATTKVTWSLANVALSIWALHWNIWSWVLTPIFGKKNNNSNIEQEKNWNDDFIPKWWGS